MQAENEQPAEKPAIFNWAGSAGPIFRYGLGVGLGLVLFGALCMYQGITTQPIAKLLVSAGLGIVLGAFGAGALLKLPQGITVMGVAALAVLLFQMLQNNPTESYVKVTISGDVQETQVDFVGERSYLGAFQKAERFYRFIVFGNELSHSVMSLYITTTADHREFIFDCIKKDLIAAHMASGGTVSWRFNKAKGELLNATDDSLVAKVGSCRNAGQASLHFPDLISSAHAQPSFDAKPIIQQLESESGYVRRNARTTLARMGTSAVAPILESMRKQPTDYRTRLGLVVALAEMMREHKAERQKIAGMMSQADLAWLAQAATDEDRTIRIYASEFLYDLGDPRTVQEVKKQFPTAGDDGRFNLLLSLQGTVPYLNAAQKTDVAKFASSIKPEVGPQTNKLADTLVQQTAKR